MSRVDVVVPCYNYAHFLRESVESVLTQPGVDVRVLILDDASPDQTPEVARQLVSDDRRVEYRRHAVNVGHIATFNEGLEWAQADYTLLQSADDLLTPGALARAARVMDEHPEVGLTYGRHIILYQGQSAGDHRPEPGHGSFRIISGRDFLETTCVRGINLVPTASVVSRTALHKKLGGLRPELPHTADMEMGMRCAAHASVGVVDADQAFYRTHGKNMHIEVFGTALADLRQRWLAFQLLFQHHADRIADGQRLRRLAQRVLAKQAIWEAHGAFDSGDVAGCEQFVELAAAIDPEMTELPQWSRLRWKRLVGPKVWSLIRPTVCRLRGRRAREPLADAGHLSP